MYQLKAAIRDDGNPKYLSLIFGDRRATYVYPTPLHYSPHNETPSLAKKVTSVILVCGKEIEIEFSEMQGPFLPIDILKEIQRLIQKSS